MSSKRVALPVVCDGLRLAVEARVPPSPRAAVVLLHGLPSAAPRDPADPGYGGLAERFAQAGFAAVWGDMRGVRGSPGYFSIEGWVRDATAMVDAARAIEGGEGLPVALVGSSAGGVVAAEAARRGAPVSALVLLASPATWLSFATSAGDGLRRVQEETGMQVAPEVAEDPSSWAEEFTEIATERSIVGLRIPILVVHGTADEVVLVEHAYRIAERAPTADLQIIEGAPHHLRRHREAIERVLSWLGRVLS